MSRIIEITTVKETRLWKELSNRSDSPHLELPGYIVSLCEEASERMKAMFSFAPQYTLHDERHLIRTTELMGLILGNTIAHLNELELTFLILSAFFHDQGMVITSEEFSNLETDEKFKLFKNNWLIEHPNHREISSQLCSPILSQVQKEHLSQRLSELNTAMLLDYIRLGHGERASEFIRSNYLTDKRMEIQGTNLSPYLAKLCESHTFSAENILPGKNFNFDEQIGAYRVNFPFIATILRVADILDFDRDRTPEVLLRSIHFTSAVSLFEWNKHRSVEGWNINEEQIRFTIQCEHPAYEAAARRYMDWIDLELGNCFEVISRGKLNGGNHHLKLPTHVDRSRIGAKDNAYCYHNLEFSLSRDEIVHLLMTDKLYGHDNLFIRELLQNSMDALRYRKALFSASELDWPHGQVEFKHFINEDGYEVLECKDNGSGMDEDIIKNHFVKVGRSFYRSPFFEQERNRLKSTGNDFDPCARFGIGFMSCFMFGDRIKIKTRRDYGTSKGWGPPLEIEIHGLSGLIVVKKGDSKQPVGTAVSIVSRQRTSYIDTWSDRLRLCAVLKGYALATEFSIRANCEIPEIEEVLEIPNNFENTPTILEVAKVKKAVCFHQDLSDVSPDLRGYVRDSFLLDENGLPCIANSEAEWVGRSNGPISDWFLRLCLDKTEINRDSIFQSVPVCADGILISGPPGRASANQSLRMLLGEQSSQIYSRSSVLIDSRGQAKPEITTRRTRPDLHGMESPPGWIRLEEALKIGQGLIGGRLIDYFEKGLASTTFWQLTVIYGIEVDWIPCEKLWRSLEVPLVKENHLEWRKLEQLGSLEMISSHHGFILKNDNNQVISAPADLEAWEKSGEKDSYLSWRMNSIVLLMANLDVVNSKVIVSPQAPSKNGIILKQYKVSSVRGVKMLYVNYIGNAENALVVQTPFNTANRNHPLTIESYSSRNSTEKSDLQAFAHAFVNLVVDEIGCGKDSTIKEGNSIWKKRVAHLFFSIDWKKYDSKYAPPYKLWSESKKWISFAAEDFEKWRNSTSKND